jgi:hypothetical protein
MNSAVHPHRGIIKAAIKEHERQGQERYASTLMEAASTVTLMLLQ